MESIYLETSFFSYLTAKPSLNIIANARQQITQNWWGNESKKYNLYISEFVIAEAQRGDKEASELRINFIKNNDIQILNISDECISLAEKLFKEIKFPINAQDDALHIAISIFNKIDYLLTWNCRHIANAHFIKKILHYCEKHSLVYSQICTPEEMTQEE